MWRIAAENSSRGPGLAVFVYKVSGFASTSPLAESKQWLGIKAGVGQGVGTSLSRAINCAPTALPAPSPLATHLLEILGKQFDLDLSCCASFYLEFRKSLMIDRH